MTKRALVSVYYKTGILEFARELRDLGFDIVSTGGTYNFLKENGFVVKSVDSITHFPEILGGRVKTLHPGVLAGILAEKDNDAHTEDMRKHELPYYDVVAVNLYPFTETISKPGVTPEEAIEKIDIGGVTLIRAAAKNFKYISIITDSKGYKEFTETYKKYGGSIPIEYSKILAMRAFSHIEQYDRAIADYFIKLNSDNHKSVLSEKLSGVQKLRYGENPHQKAVLRKTDFDDLFKILHGKELSYNNILDINAAYNLISEFKENKPTCAIIKHGNPCGTATAENLTDAYKTAFSTDTVSPFGGIIIFNKKLDLKATEEADKIFTEIILAPDFDDDALELLKKKKNRRIVSFTYSDLKKEIKSVAGGILEQEPDIKVLEINELKTVTKKHAGEKETEDMIFAYKIVKHTKSNAIVFAKDCRTLGIGAGQPSRLDSTKLAAGKAQEFKLSLKNSVVASDAFFPFADGLIETAKAGAVCVIQPGGSVRDEDVIRAADEYGLCMIFTGYRHFRH